MIVKFMSRGTGGGSGPVDYLLGKDRKREGAQLLSGDAEETKALIDGSQFVKKYTSGVLSFEEESISPEQKREIMQSFEECLFTGLDANQYNVLWVEHTDKGRLELNFVIPNIELTTGKRLQPYYHAADKPRVDAWQTIQNIKHDFSDPHDPAKRQALVLAKDLPRNNKEAAEALHAGLESLVEQGVIHDRDSLVATLETAGFEIGRATKNSVSIKNPDGGRNIRLSGAIYEQDFRLSKDLQRTIEQSSERHRETSTERLRAAEHIYQSGIESKSRYYFERYKKQPEPRQREKRSNELTERFNSRAREEQSRAKNGSLREQQGARTGYLRTQAQNEHELIQNMVDSNRGLSGDSARIDAVEHDSRLEHSRAATNFSDIGGRGGQDSVQPLRRPEAVMRQDRRESTPVSGRIPSNQRILDDERDRRSTVHGLERVNREVFKLRERTAGGQQSSVRGLVSTQAERERSGKLERASGAVSETAKDFDRLIGGFEEIHRRVNTAKRGFGRGNEFIVRTKSAISRASGTIRDLYERVKEAVLSHKQEQEQKQKGRGMSR